MKSQKILSEINRMRSLLTYQRGVVISEQKDNSYNLLVEQDMYADARTISDELKSTFNADEQKIVNIMKKYDDSKKFSDFLVAFKQVTGKDLGQAFGNTFSPYTDRKEWADMKSFLDKISVTMTMQNDNKGNSTVVFNVQQPKTDSKVTGDTINPQKATVFTPNETFPLKFQQKGEKIKQLQTALGVKNKNGQPNITGKFWTATEIALKNKAKEIGLVYDRAKGVDEKMFNQIISSNKTETSNEPLSSTTTDVGFGSSADVAQQGFRNYTQSQFGTQLN